MPWVSAPRALRSENANSARSSVCAISGGAFMVTRDQLRERALRAYERGRLRTAVRVAWFLVPLTLLCALETGAGEKCVCSGALLLGAALYLRWRDRQGANAVSTGLLAGSL